MKENRESFFNRLRSFLAPSELNRVRFGYETAKAAHRGQVRKELDELGQRIRYFEHLRACALIMMVEAGYRDPDAVCAMLLHDTGEDTDLDMGYVEQFLGPAVARGVIVLTKRDDESDEEYAARLLEINEWFILLGKLCDTVHNLRKLYACAPEKQGPKIDEVRKLRRPIFEKLLKIAPDAYRDAIRRLVDEVNTIVDDYLRDGTLPQSSYTPPE